MAELQNPTQRDDEIDLGELLGKLQDHKWLVIGVTAIFFVASVAYALFATPIYQADAIVQAEQKVPHLPGLSALSQTLGASSSEATTEIALITSRSVLGKTVDSLHLEVEVHPQRFPLIGHYVSRRFLPAAPTDVAPALMGMSRYDWGNSAASIFKLDVPTSLLDDNLLLIAGENSTYTLLSSDGNTVLNGVVGQPATGHGATMILSALRANPGTRFQVIRHRALSVVIGLQKDVNVIEQGKDSGVIKLSYQNADPDLAMNVLNEVSQFYVRQNVERNSAEAAQSLTFVREQLPNVRRELEKATAALSAFQTTARSVDITLQTKAILDQEVAIETSIQQLRMRQADMDRRFTQQHPAYKALLEQIGQLEGQKNSMEKQVGNLPDTQQVLLRLTRDVQVSNETYTALLNQAQQLDIARAGTVGNVRIIDAAAVDTTQPVKPRKAILVLGITLLGALLAAGFVLLRDMLHRGIEDPADIEELGLPVYASIPVSLAEKQSSVRGKDVHGNGRQQLLVVTDPADLAAEALRSLRTSLHFTRMEARNNVLMISGASPEAGKTFVSANLAAVVAQSGQRVLLIDGDMRKGALHKVIGGHGESGLSELIVGQRSFDDVVRPVPGVETLSFIARGKVPPNPSELLMNARFTALLDRLKPQFDLILIDTPPILAVTDAAVIGHHAGTSLLVTRFGLNQAREIALAKQRFEQNGVALKGAIFNAVEKRAAGYSSYGYYEYS